MPPETVIGWFGRLHDHYIIIISCLYLRLWKISHTIYDANGKVSHIHRRMCKWDYTIDKLLVCLQSERRTSC